MGTLRQALYYPQATPAMDTKDLVELLHLCKLDKLANQLENTNDWSRILSLGEQQRLAFVRILLKKPTWIFLDEATSALDEDTEAYMYTLLKKELPHATIISVGHHMTLLSHHKYRLKLNNNGSYLFFPLNAIPHMNSSPDC